MTVTRTFALLAGLALHSSAAELRRDDSEPLVGGYGDPQPIVESDVDFLVTYLSDPLSYSEDVSTRICFTAFYTVQQQTVSGTNFRYRVKGCPVTSPAELGTCRNENSNCGGSPYDVVVYSQPWTNTLYVSSITKVV
ncbi:unnamed protein product [Hyaloperonospora brassicae]|uniref:Uncharacterized protein n=1 Tax=Hyaloperonospora brassicae TaxID=162125 RepID=A0AAV0UNH9_HYABA|nr:unnamed protein product [Hyaloperonospora brassicae]